MTFDGYAYERQQKERLEQAGQALRAMAAYRAAVDQDGRGPVKVLSCPRGHRLLPVRLDDHQGKIFLFPLPDHRARRSGRVTSHASPWRTGKRLCPAPGCGAIVTHDGYCDAHGGDDIEAIDPIRTDFTCRAPQCNWSEPVTTARLLQLYGMAIYLGRENVILGDTPG